MSDNLRDILLFLCGAAGITALLLWLLYVVTKNTESECSCPPTVIRSQDGTRFVSKIYHRPLCRFFQKGTP